MNHAHMVKFIVHMKTTNSQILPAPPHLFKTLVAGFDTITNHIALILFPIGLDLLIWLAPRLNLKSLIEPAIKELISQSIQIAPDANTVDMLDTAQEMWKIIGERINLLAVLRSYPVGIPSLMSSILPLEIPNGTPTIIEVTSPGNVALLLLVIAALGLVLGTLFFSAVSQAAISGKIQWQSILIKWPWMSWQTILLALLWLALLIGVSVPAFCVLSLVSLGSIALGQCATLMYTSLLIWIIFPLLFSPHGIFVNHHKVWPSVKQGMRITRLTLPTTSLFFMSILLITQGFDFLWRLPPENSWMALIGLTGHAFVTTGLLAASFIYYRDADQWIMNLQDQAIQNENASNKDTQ